MTDASRRLLTPVYVKTDAEGDVPRDKECFYLLSRSGLFIGRNQPLMRSLVPALSWPRELEPQEPFLQLTYPKVPADILADIIGFFWSIADRHGAEAAVLLGYDGAMIVPIVPEQTGTIGWGYGGKPYPIGLHYDIPLELNGLRIIGDIHSHVFEAAYASSVDMQDERHRPGLHIVAGRLDRDPPAWHVEYVVDGARFPIAPEAVLDLNAYEGRVVPTDTTWTDRVEVMTAGEYARRHARPTSQNSSQHRTHSPR